MDVRALPDDLTQPTVGAPDGSDVSLLDLLLPLVERRWMLLIGPLAAGLAALGVSFVLTPTYTAKTTFLPPQQQSTPSAALMSLGALSGLAGAAAGLKSPSDQYVSLMQSNAVADGIIKQFDLVRVYEVRWNEEARRRLRERARVISSRKDNLIVVEVDDDDPQRAAAIANQHVEELRLLTNRLAITEAQQRRAFFESQLKQTRDRLARAQLALQASGFNEASLRAEPKAAAEAYARLRAEATAAEVRIGVLRQTLSETAPELQNQLALLQGLRGQVARIEAASDSKSSSGEAYIDRYREFKYQETLFDLFARQYELARVDESREGGLIQVVDAAAPPELPSRPRRAVLVALVTLGTLALMVSYLVARRLWQLQSTDPAVSEKLARLRSALGRN